MWDFLIKRPMLLSAVAASVISVMGLYTGRALFVVCAVILAFIFVALYKRIKGELIFSLILIFAVSISSVFAFLKVENADKYQSAICTGEFLVVSEPSFHGTFYNVTLETVKSATLKTGDKIEVYYNEGDIEYGDEILAEISVNTLKDSEYKKDYYSRGIYLSGSIKNFENTQKTDGVLKTLKSFRDYIEDKIYKNYDTEEAATMLALVSGDKSHFSDEFYSNVKGAGVSHVMVVSGMHLSVFVALFLFLCSKLFYNRFLKAVTIIAVTVGVMAVCGFTMSILRAGLTYMLMALALCINRENTSENTLGAAVTLILLFNPLAIFSIAFQLSVLSTFAILVVAIPVVEWVSKRKIIKSKILLGLITTAFVSLVCLLFTSPVAIYVFGYVSNVSLLTNLLIGTVASAAMILCVLGFMCPPLSGVLFAVGNLIVKYINWVINYFGSLKYAVTHLPKWSALVLLGVLIIILYVLLACKVKRDMVKLNNVQEKIKKQRGAKKLNGNNFGIGIKKQTKNL